MTPPNSKLSEAQLLFKEFAKRIPHVAEIVIGAKSKAGNWGLITHENLSIDTLRKIKSLITEEIRDRKALESPDGSNIMNKILGPFCSPREDTDGE